MPDETSMWETVDQSARAGPRNEADSTTWRPIVQNRHPKTNCQVGIFGAHNGERPTRHARGPVLARNRTIATPTDTQLGLTERRPVTGTHQSDNPAAAIDQRVRSQEPTTLTHSGQQSPNGDVSKPHSSTWNLHHTDVKIQKLTSGNTTPSYTRPTRQATSRANLNGVERRTRVSNVCQVPKPVVTRIGRNSGEVCMVKNNFKFNKVQQVNNDKMWLKSQSHKVRLILALGWRWENSQVPDGM